MKGKMTLIIVGTVGTMLAVTGFILSASARNLPRFIGAQKLDYILFPPIRPNSIIFNFADNAKNANNGKENLHSEPGDEMRNSFNQDLNAGQQQSVRYMVGDLNFDELQGGARSNIENRGGMRIDRQGQTSNNEQNIQVQVNGVTGRSTVAAILIPNQYLGNNLTQPSRQEVIRVVRDALLRSLANFQANDPKIYKVTGSLSN